MEPRKCGVHGLIAGDDGKCVICRRGDEAPEPQSTSSDWPVVVVFGALALVVAVGGGIVLSRKIDERGAVDVPIVMTAEIDAPSASGLPPPEPNPFAGERKPWDPPREEEVSASPVVSEEPTPEEIGQAKRRVSVTMYMTKSCQLCSSARFFMKSQKLSMKELDVEESPTEKVLLESVNPKGSVPTFEVDGKILVGFDQQGLDSAIESAARKRLRR